MKDITEYVYKILDDYKKFADLQSFPKMNIEIFSFKEEDIKNNVFLAPAQHFYDYVSNTHTIRIWDNINLLDYSIDYILFHEFTHAIDYDNYCKKNKVLIAAIKGYTEFHAAQIDLLKLLDTQNIKHIKKFSVNDTLLNNETVSDYIIKFHSLMKNAIHQSKIVTENIIGTIAIIFNYLGYLYICEKYAIDFNKIASQFQDTSLEDNFCGNELIAIKQLLKIEPMTDKVINAIGFLYLKLMIKFNK